MKAKEKGEGIAEFFMSRRKVKETFFNQMNRIVDWSRLRPIIEKGYVKGTSHTGRPCYDAMVLFCIELLRTWYNLSDVEVEEQVNDRLSFSRFSGIRLDEASPDSTTIGRFRNALVRADVYDSMPRSRSARSLRKWKSPTWTRKLVMRAPIDKAGLAPRTPVYADKGYASRENNRMLGERRLKSRIMHKGVRGRDLSQREQRVNVGISRVRYRIERTYGSIRRWFGGGVARYVGLAKTHAQHIMEAIAYNLYRMPGIIVSNCE